MTAASPEAVSGSGPELATPAEVELLANAIGLVWAVALCGKVKFRGGVTVSSVSASHVELLGPKSRVCFTRGEGDIWTKVQRTQSQVRTLEGEAGVVVTTRRIIPHEVGWTRVETHQRSQGQYHLVNSGPESEVPAITSVACHASVDELASLLPRHGLYAAVGVAAINQAA
jgi:hypothetical protein